MQGLTGSTETRETRSSMFPDLNWSLARGVVTHVLCTAAALVHSFPTLSMAARAGCLTDPTG